MDLVPLFEQFRAWNEGMAKSTLANYEGAIRSLVRHGVTTTEAATRRRVAEWLEALRSGGRTANTCNTKLAGVLSVLSFAEKREIFPLEQLMGLRRIRLRFDPTPEPDYLSREQLCRLRIAALSIHEKLDLAVAFSFFAGLRMMEFLRLEKEDLKVWGSSESKPFLVVSRERGETKTKRSRTTPIPAVFAAELRDRVFDEGPVFPPLKEDARGRHMSFQTMKEWLYEARRRAGLPGTKWPSLRHSFFTHLVQSGVSLDKCCKWGGNTRRVAEKFYTAQIPGFDPDIERAFGAPFSSPRDVGGAP